METPRREFLIASGRLLMLTGVAAGAFEALVNGEEVPEPYRAARHWWAFMIDIDKCIGCGLCVQACKTENGVLHEPYYFRTWVERYRVREHDREHPIVDSPNGGFDGFAAIEPRDDERVFFLPKMCNHCVDSPCVQVCPVGATFRTVDGVVLVDKTYCLGCRYCVQACPYGCRYIDPRTQTVDKCTLCYHRITKGLTTACAEVCPTGARKLGDLKDPNDPIHAFLREHPIQVLKPNMATEPKVYYTGLDGSAR
jgi:Fe-S-cluster-containing dehydrogenase component